MFPIYKFRDGKIKGFTRFSKMNIGVIGGLQGSKFKWMTVRRECEGVRRAKSESAVRGEY
jgi:hypothetical protein